MAWNPLIYPDQIPDRADIKPDGTDNTEAPVGPADPGASDQIRKKGEPTAPPVRPQGIPAPKVMKYPLRPPKVG